MWHLTKLWLLERQIRWWLSLSLSSWLIAGSGFYWRSSNKIWKTYLKLKQSCFVFFPRNICMKRRQIFFFLHFRRQWFFGLHGHQLLPAEEAWLRQQVYWLHLFLGESLGFQPNLGGACWEAQSFWHGSKSQWHMCIIINVILFECVGQQASDKRRKSQFSSIWL